MPRSTALVTIAVLVLALMAPAATAQPHADHAPDGGESQVLVKLATNLDVPVLGGVDLASLPGVTDVAGVIDQIGVHVLEVAPGTADQVAHTLDALPIVAYAEPNGAFELMAATPNDALLGDQYALERIDAVAGWERYRAERGYGASFPATGGATIAVIDSGLDTLLHSEFSGKVTQCQNWLLQIGVGLPTCQDNNVHGTHVTGIAAAAANNNTGIAGVAFDAQVQALQACTVLCAFADVAAATVHAVDAGADVINFSFGAPVASNAMADAIEYAAARGVLMVGAAGNTGVQDSVIFPASHGAVIAVSSTGPDDRLSPFSSYGPQVEVAAPGTAILSTYPAGLVYGEMDGTSMAAPHVTGLAALLMAMGADATQARHAIVGGADDVGLPADQQGAGRINVANSVRLLADG